MRRTWTLIDSDGSPYDSATPGTLGGHRRSRIYGRLDCPSARRALARGGYAAQRVFFADEATALAAGYRPCAVCMRERYRRRKADPEGFALTVSSEDESGSTAGGSPR